MEDAGPDGQHHCVRKDVLKNRTRLGVYRAIATASLKQFKKSPLREEPGRGAARQIAALELQRARPPSALPFSATAVAQTSATADPAAR